MFLTGEEGLQNKEPREVYLGCQSCSAQKGSSRGCSEDVTFPSACLPCHLTSAQSSFKIHIWPLLSPTTRCMPQAPFHPPFHSPCATSLKTSLTLRWKGLRCDHTPQPLEGKPCPSSPRPQHLPSGRHWAGSQ